METKTVYCCDCKWNRSIGDRILQTYECKKADKEKRGFLSGFFKNFYADCNNYKKGWRADKIFYFCVWVTAVISGVAFIIICKLGKN